MEILIKTILKNEIILGVGKNNKTYSKPFHCYSSEICQHNQSEEALVNIFTVLIMFVL